MSASTGARDHAGRLASGALATAAAAVVAATAYDRGGFAVESRTTLALGVWWLLLLGVALGLWPAGRIGRWPVAALGTFAAFAAWTLASALWAPSSEGAFADGARTLGYVGVFALGVLAGSRATLRAWSGGVAAGIAGICLLALASRLFPGLMPGRPLATFLPAAAPRLSFPLEYWNALGVFAALGVPLLLALAARSAWPVRAAAVGVIPALTGVVYLTSSRGAALALLVGIVVFVAASGRRWVAAGSAAAALAGSAVVVGVLLRRDALVDGPVGSAAARAEGRGAALLIAVACLAAAAVHEVALRAGSRVPAPPRAARVVALALVAAAVLVGAAAGDPGRRLDEFRRLPAAGPTLGTPGYAQAHLSAVNGSGRWQFWAAAVDEFADAPLHGGGAASYERWWARHASFAYAVQDAHSLYLETLAELGLVGAALLTAFLAVSLAAGLRGLRALRGDERALAAGLLGACAAYLLAAGVDWMWELPAVTGVFVLCLGLLVAATRPAASAAAAAAAAPRRRAVAAVALGALVLCVEGMPLLAQLELRASRDAAARGDLGAALVHARRAERVQPWAASTRLQVALVREASGDLDGAREALDRTQAVDDTDWRTWLVRARIDAAAGDEAGARRSLARARALSPRSDAFAPS